MSRVIRKSHPWEVRILVAITAFIAVSALGSGRAVAQSNITEIIDCTGDGTGICAEFGVIATGNTLEEPIGIAVDGAGNVYVTGQASDNAFKITPAGVITEIIDSTGDRAGPSVSNLLASPAGIAVGPMGNVYVTGETNAFKITPAGAITEIIDATGDGAGNALRFSTIVNSSIAVDTAGNVYVTGGGGRNAFKITPAGVITQIIDGFADGLGVGTGRGRRLDNPGGIAVDAAGNVYVTGFFSDNAFKITPEGVITQIIDFTGDGASNGLSFPVGIAVDTAGNVYVAGTSSDNAFKITPEGVITQIIDSTGDGAGNDLNGPSGIAVDPAGNVYVTGKVSDNAFKITPEGIITQIIHDTGNDLIRFRDPQGIAVDAGGNVYVAGGSSFSLISGASGGTVFWSRAFKITPAGVSDAPPAADPGDGAGDLAPTTDCGDSGTCGTAGMMMMSLTFLGIGWMKRPRRTLTRKSPTN